MSRWHFIPHKGERLFSVGILPDGTLWNPNRYPEDLVREAVFEADERRRQKIAENRGRGAKKAAVTRARRREMELLTVAKKMLRDEKIGPALRCVLCFKALTDPLSINRGIGPECWQHVLQRMERVRASAESAEASQPATV